MQTSTFAPRRCRRAYSRVLRQADRLDELARADDESLATQVAAISGWSVGAHLDHLAYANRAMAGAIRKILDSPIADSKRGPTLVGRIVMMTGWIPRGVGKAPEYTTPNSGVGEPLTQNLRAAREAIEGLAGSLSEVAQTRARVDHFAFGGLTAYQWLRVMGVHTHHHLKIIRDIQRGSR